MASGTAARLTELAQALGKSYKALYRIVDDESRRPGRGAERWLDTPEIITLTAVLKLADALSAEKMRTLYACSVDHLKERWQDAQQRRMLLALVQDRCDFRLTDSVEQERSWLGELAEQGAVNVVVDVPQEVRQLEQRLGRIRRMAPQRRRGRPRMPDVEHDSLLDQASGFSAGDDVSQEEINELI